MPAAPRRKCLATKIAYKVLGTPANIAFKRSKQQEQVDKQLNAQETSRVR
jgi:hypothetical protein